MRLSEFRCGRRGQGLTEYLILVCLIAIAAISVVSVVGQNLRSRFASISSALRGDKEVKKNLAAPDEATYEVRGFDDFTEGAAKPESR